MTAGLIGLGLMGSAIAHRMMRAGVSVWGHDCSPEAMSAFSLKGGQAIVQIGDVPIAANPVILALPGPDVVHAVVAKILPRLKPGTMLIDVSSGDPLRTKSLADHILSAGVTLIDAAILGPSNVTRDGNAQLLVGGSLDAVQQCRYLLEVISRRIHHIGPVGTGQKMRAVANLVYSLNLAVLSEGLHLAQQLSIDPYRLLDVMTAGAAYSRVMDSKGLRMIQKEFSPHTRLRQQLTDVELLLKSAADVGSELPLSEAQRLLLLQAIEDGHGDRDCGAISRAWEKLV